MGKLTTKAAENAAIREKEYKLSDGDGLFLRMQPSGAKSWLYCYRLPGDRRVVRMTLGALKDLTLKEARNKLVELRKLVAEGIDPRSDRAATRTFNSQAITLQELYENWIEFVKRSGEVTLIWAKRHEDRWRLHLKKPLGGLLARDVTRGHLAAALEAMSIQGIKEETRKALTTLNLLLDYGLSRHFIEHNPARVLKPKDFAATANRPRDRVLSISELRKLWIALDLAVEGSKKGLARTARISIITATAIKLLILTGARRGELASMTRDSLNLEAGIWHLEASKTKNRKAHTIYLSKLAIKLIKSLTPISGNSNYVFDTGSYSGQGHIHQDTLSGAISSLRNVCAPNESSPLKDVPPFTIHDLRRSAATAWGEYLKTAPHVIERMLNHQPLNKLVATYQHAVYANEQKAAWLRWGEMIEHHVMRDPNNVVMLKKKSSTYQ